MRSWGSRLGLLFLAGMTAMGLVGLTWMIGVGSSEAQQDAMVNCPQPGKWSIAVWDGPSDADAESALDTCATAVAAAYHIDPETQGWLRWFAGRPEISNLQSLDELQGVLALGGTTTAAAASGVETLSAAQADQMVKCPQPGKWSIAVWDGSSGTDTESALDTCATAVAAAYHLDPETQGWLRWFAGRPEISNLQSLDELQGVLALGTAAAAAPVTFAVDESVTPAVSELPGFEDGVPRPLASIVDELGNQADFVADELLLVTDDSAALDDFLDRWEGEVLLTFDPTEYGLTGMSPMYLVRINTGLADASALEADLQALTQEGEGDHRVSSEEALDLLAAAASEAADGLDIGVNWVGTGADFRTRTTSEAPTEPTAPTAPSGYSTNTFDWVHLNAGSTQDIGVTEAWRALDIMGRLDNTVEIAVLDMGFEPDDDFPTPWTAISNVPFVDPIGTENFSDCGGPCPYHGTNVVGAAMGMPDNDFGGAGVAGPIAEPILVFTLYDFATGIVAVARAASEGADIINMSYGARVPTIVAWTVYPFEWTTEAVRDSGVLLFAAAGNDGANVDSERCFLGICWERAWHTPCENDGVICVGGLGWDSQNRAGNSNRGPEDVDIFAPWWHWVGPDPADTAYPGNYAQEVGGTSGASPYAAGVAALIWAADPSLSADEVEDILYATAHTSPDADVDRYVNAYDGVMMALGPAPPQISITSPADGSSHSRGADSIAFIADAIDVEDDTLPVTWTSSLDGQIGTATQVYRRDLSTGTHTITAATTDSDGLTASDSITITIVNDPPTMEITSPGDGAERFQGQTIYLRGLSSDPNTVPLPYAPLPDAQVEWSIDGDPPFATGHEASIPGDTLSLGTHTISFTGSDGELEHTDTITITVVAGTGIDVRIISPANGSSWSAEAEDGVGWYKEVTLVGEADDPEDGPLSGGSLVWTTSINGGPEQELGTGESVTVRLYAPECTSTHEITLTATDSDDNSVTDTITVTVILLC